MAEIKNNYLFAGILLAVALVTAGVTYELKPTGNYKVCNNGVGWQFNSGTGKYDCGNDRSFDCSSVRNTNTGKSNYYCDEAVRVEVKETVKTVSTQTSCPQQSCPSVRVIKYDYDGSKFLCDDKGQNCVSWENLADTNFK